ncbi:MAG: tyrosine-type recombinase/integrase [Acidobacteria bacterium]|nr:tyrosine-type recombinase/integrase [Acidobacteriota bacterium]
MSQTAIEPEMISPLPATTDASRRLIPLKDKLLAFLNRSTSENTREAYQRTILVFHRFVGRHLLSVTEREVHAWRDSLLLHGQLNQTVASKLSTVRSFYAYLLKVCPQYVTLNPADQQLVLPPRIPNTLKGRALTPKEVRYMLVGPDMNTPEGARDYALMLLMLRLSLRVSEGGSVRRSSFQWKDGRWTLTLKVKGGAEEVWPLPPDVKGAIDHYLRLDEKRRSVWLENRTEDQYVFQPIENHRTGRHNRGLTRQMIGKIVKKWADFTGIKGKVTPHDLRRTAITRALNQGRTYREVQMMSKHKDPKTVMRYDYERDNLERNPVNSLSYEDE